MLRNSVVVFSVGGHCLVSFGNNPVSRSALDSAEFWTFVDNTAFQAYGKVKELEVYVGATSRAIHFGIYRLTPGASQMMLVQRHSIASLPVGYNKVNMVYGME